MTSMVLGDSTLESVTPSVNAISKSSSNYHNVQGKLCTMVGTRIGQLLEIGTDHPRLSG